MEEYDVTMKRGWGTITNLSVRIETTERQLLDAVMEAVEEAWDKWYRGEL